MAEAGDRRPIAARHTRPAIWLADRLIRAGVSPNAISLAGMAAGVGAGLAMAAIAWAPAVARPLWLLAALLLQLRLLANLLDGMVAIGRGVASARGELFNEVPDRVSDSAILIGLGIKAGMPWLGLAAALAAMATAYVRAIGRAAGASSEFCGPMAKQHRVALIIALALWCALTPHEWRPAIFALGHEAWVLIAITVLSLVTAWRRLMRIARALDRTA